MRKSTTASTSTTTTRRDSLLLFLFWCITINLTYNFAQQRLRQQQQQQETGLGSGAAYIQPSGGSSAMERTAIQQQQQQPDGWDDLWWTTNFKDTVLRLDENGMIVFPPEIKRVWIDVGTHIPKLNIQKVGGQCNSLLRPNSNSTAGLGKFSLGCIEPERDKQGNSVKYNVPGIPLAFLLARIPDHVEVEFLKIDAQGYDLEVMKGALLIPSGELQHHRKLPHIMSLEAMDTQNKSALMYFGQPTLDEIKVYLQSVGWFFLKATDQNKKIHEVNAFFASNRTLASKVSPLIVTL